LKGEDSIIVEAENKRIIDLVAQIVLLDNEFFNKCVKYSIIDANNIISSVINKNDENFILLLEALGESEDVANIKELSTKKFAQHTNTPKDDHSLDVRQTEIESEVNNKNDKEEIVDNKKYKKKSIEVIIPDEDISINTTKEIDLPQNIKGDNESKIDESKQPNSNKREHTRSSIKTNHNTIKQYIQVHNKGKSNIDYLSKFKDPMKPKLQYFSRFTARSRTLDIKHIFTSNMQSKKNPLHDKSILKNTKLHVLLLYTNRNTCLLKEIRTFI